MEAASWEAALWMTLGEYAGLIGHPPAHMCIQLSSCSSYFVQEAEIRMLVLIVTQPCKRACSLADKLLPRRTPGTLQESKAEAAMV